MSTKKITALTELSAAPAATDMIPIVDVSDTTDAGTGTTKKITATNVGKGIGIGAGNTTAEPVKIDTSNGRLGVGTDSPDTLVEISSDTSSLANTLRFTDTDTTTAADQQIGKIEFYSSDSDRAEVKAYIGAFAGDTTPDGYLAFATQASSSSVAERMRITKNGRVGIGTDTPDEMLQVESTSASGAAIQIESTAADSYPSVRFVNDAREWRIYAPAGTTSDGFQIYDATVPATRLFIDTSGNVGIGTTVPAELLDVDGILKVRGSGSPWANILLQNESANNSIKLHNYGGSGASKLNIGDNLYVLEGTGVGIGQTAPGAKLEVEVADEDNVVGLLVDQNDVTNNKYAISIENAGTGDSIRDDSGAKLTAAGVFTDASDELKKKNIAQLGHGLAEVLKLKPKKFKYKKGSIDGIGFLAQEVEAVIPEVVHGDDAEVKDVVISEAEPKSTRQKTTKVQKEVKRIEKIKEGGKWIEKEITETKEVDEPVYEEVDLYNATGNKTIGKHNVPVMEEVKAKAAVIAKDQMVGGKSIAYGSLTAVLVKAIQELSAKVTALENA